MNVSIARAQNLVAKFRRQKILVVGDLMLDRYIYGTVSRISPEAPVPVVLVGGERNMPGGAANVARNAQALGGQTVLSGVVGRDQPGRALLAVLAKAGVGARGVWRLSGTQTIVKTRILAERQQIARVDRERPLVWRDATLRRFCRDVAQAVQAASGVIIADYAKGTIRQAVVDAVLSAAKRKKIPVALDPKENLDLQFEGLTVATPNRREAFQLARLPEKPPADNPLRDQWLLQVADSLLRQWNPRFLVITLGAQGMLLVSRDRSPCHLPTVAREVFDVSGAGDTVIATMLLALAAGATHSEAAELANCAAGVVVGKVGTAVCAGAELLEFLSLLHRQGIDIVTKK